MTATSEPPAVDPYTDFATCPKCGRMGTCGSRCTKKPRKQRLDNELPDGCKAWYLPPNGGDRFELKLRGNHLVGVTGAMSKNPIGSIVVVADSEGWVPNAIFAAKRLARLDLSDIRVYCGRIAADRLRWTEARIRKLTAAERRGRKALEEAE